MEVELPREISFPMYYYTVCTIQFTLSITNFHITNFYWSANQIRQNSLDIAKKKIHPVNRETWSFIGISLYCFIYIIYDHDYVFSRVWTLIRIKNIRSFRIEINLFVISHVRIFFILTNVIILEWSYSIFMKTRSKSFLIVGIDHVNVSSHMPPFNDCIMINP